VYGLNRERNETHALTVVVQDDGSPRQNATAIYTVRVMDVNDRPRLFVLHDTTDPSSVQGWSNHAMATTGDGFVHGMVSPIVSAADGISPPAGAVARTFNLSSAAGAEGHSDMTIAFRFWAADWISAPTAELWLDSVRVWNVAAPSGSSCTGNGWSLYPRPFLSTVAVACYVDINVTVPHAANSALVHFDAVSSSATLAETWGFGRLLISTDGVRQVNEHAEVGTAVGGAVQGFDPDGHPLTYSIVGGNDAGYFEMGSSTGQIAVARDLDFEVMPDFDLSVQVCDNFTQCLHTSSSNVRVRLIDINDAPEFTSGIVLSVAEITDEHNVPANSYVGQLSSTDQDRPDDGVVYSVVSGRLTTTISDDCQDDPSLLSCPYYALNPTTGVIVTTASYTANYEIIDFHEVTVRATDNFGASVDKALNISILDINERLIWCCDLRDNDLMPSDNCYSPTDGSYTTNADAGNCKNDFLDSSARTTDIIGAVITVDENLEPGSQWGPKDSVGTIIPLELYIYDADRKQSPASILTFNITAGDPAVSSRRSHEFC
jgi:hypothetical protein